MRSKLNLFDEGTQLLFHLHYQCDKGKKYLHHFTSVLWATHELLYTVRLGDPAFSLNGFDVLCACNQFMSYPEAKRVRTLLNKYYDGELIGDIRWIGTDYSQDVIPPAGVWAEYFAEYRKLGGTRNWYSFKKSLDFFFLIVAPPFMKAPSLLSIHEACWIGQCYTNQKEFDKMFRTVDNVLGL